MKYSDLNENISHGDADFPIQYYHLDPNHPQYVMPLHWHHEFEILRVLAGSIQMHLNGIRYDLTAGDILFISAGTLHCGEPQDCIYECIVVDLTMLRYQPNDRIAAPLISLTTGKSVIGTRLPEQSNALHTACTSLFALMRDKPPYYELSVHSALLGLISELYRSGAVHANTDTRHERRNESIVDALDWIGEHYHESITLADIAAVAGMSEKYLCRIFKEYTGLTPISYINSIRVENACRTMGINGLGVTDAAFECGFNDLSYFSRIFHQYKGISPSAWRRNYNAKKDN